MKKIKQDMNLKLINFKDDLIKAYPYQFEGPTTYTSESMPYLLCTDTGNAQ